MLDFIINCFKFILLLIGILVLMWISAFVLVFCVVNAPIIGTIIGVGIFASVFFLEKDYKKPK